MVRPMRTAIAALAALPLLVCTATAQDAGGAAGAAATTAAPAPPVWLELRGPAGWRSLYMPTNLGGLLASETGQRLQAMLQFADPTLRLFAFPGPAGLEQAQARLLDYDGILRIVAPSPVSYDDDPWLLTLGPDGRTDLAALAQDLMAMLAKTGICRAMPSAGDLPTRLMLPTGQCLSEFQRAAPEDPNSCWVAAVADESKLLSALADAKAAAKAAPCKPAAPNAPALRAYVNVGALLAEELEGKGRVAEEKRAFGLDALRELEVSLSAAGPHVLIEAAQSFAGDYRGLFGVLFPDRPGVPALADLRPEQASVWKIGRCDLAAIQGLAKKAAAAFGTDEDERAEDALPPAVFDEKDGLLAAFADEYAFFATPDSIQDYEEGEFDYALALRLRPEAGFLAKWQSARKDLGLRELESEDLGDGYLRQRLGGFLLLSVEAVVGPDLLVIGYGRNSQDLVAGIVAKNKQRSQSQAAVLPPAALRRHAPPGLNGMAAGSMPMILAQVAQAARFLSGVAPVGPGLPELADEIEFEQVDAVLKQHRLDVAQSLTGYDQGTWRLRVFW